MAYDIITQQGEEQEVDLDNGQELK